jgi:hypothetical protein
MISTERMSQYIPKASWTNKKKTRFFENTISLKTRIEKFENQHHIFDNSLFSTIKLWLANSKIPCQ